MTEEINVTWIPNNNFFPGRNGLKPRYVVLHGTAGGVSAQAIAAYFQSTQGGENPVSSHYIVGQDGTVIQAVSEENGAWANGALTAGHASYWDTLAGANPNNVTISIEHCKPSFDNSDALTDVQKAASFRLIKHICERHAIPMHPADARGGITSHASLDPVSRSQCPGPYPWNELFTFLRQEEKPMSTAPQGWSDDAAKGVLRSPDGYVVIQGFRQYVLSHAWAPDNWPLENEHHREELELSNPALGGGSIQRFRKTTLEWTPRRGCFEQWTGQELLELERRLQQATHQAQVNKPRS